ncbi:MAG: glutamate--tRNA ligase [Bacteroidetes bacterium HGW-Bacteroidetes-11]|jgi:glutamyl-tRNA synthetase|nr:MAG: glutamate--tRNA ligase [Bacteroidetes bacterium HGW-Bacteroidetes-11]
MKDVRVRFAPSPTGPLHIGGVRTALYNYLFAKKHGGKFLLRIEDTDQTRFVPGAEAYIIEALNWCGVSYDEGVGIGGPHAPYRQSERKELYRKYADQLVSEGHAYYAFDTSEDLDQMRDRLKAKGVATPQYDVFTRGEMVNSLTLTPEETSSRLESGDAYVIRILIPENEEILVNDLIRGEVKVHSSRLDDKVLFKSDGMPTYHMANIVDDHLMEITHVIRGEEWLPSAPLHVLLYRYLGWEAPQFAHLPLLLKPDGNGKLSKRDGDRLGFPVFPLRWSDPVSGEISSGYRESGYLPDAFINMLALLGWNPGSEKEIFTMDELVEAFSFERVGKSGSKFDPEKAKWFNHHYLSNLPNEDAARLLIAILNEKGINTTSDYAGQVCAMVKERAVLIPDLWDQSWFFFQAPESFDEKVIQKFWKPETPALLTKISALLEDTSDFSVENLDNVVKGFIQNNNLGMGQIMNTLRLVLVGGSFGPGVAAIISLLGKDETVNRISKALEKLG